ncbi:MAG: hypothetical protein HZA50_15165 [Planctomycetes bacterium]|nr:hypothetical protein [Planctomycetota bacterium]
MFRFSGIILSVAGFAAIAAIAYVASSGCGNGKGNKTASRDSRPVSASQPAIPIQNAASRPVLLAQTAPAAANVAATKPLQDRQNQTRPKTSLTVSLSDPYIDDNDGKARMCTTVRSNLDASITVTFRFLGSDDGSGQPALLSQQSVAGEVRANTPTRLGVEFDRPQGGFSCSLGYSAKTAN